MSEQLETLFHFSSLIRGFLSFSIGGLILDTTVSDPNLVGIVVYTPVINGKPRRYCLTMTSPSGTHMSSYSIHSFLQTQMYLRVETSSLVSVHRTLFGKELFLSRACYVSVRQALLTCKASVTECRIPVLSCPSLFG